MNAIQPKTFQWSMAQKWSAHSGKRPYGSEAMTKKILTVGADASLQTAIAETLSLNPLSNQGPSIETPIEGHAIASEAMEERQEDERFELIFARDTDLASVQNASPEPPQLIICHLEGCCPSASGHPATNRSASAGQTHWQILLHHWRQNAMTAQVPIILLASSQNLGSARQGMELGADDYLLTPISPNVLIGAIQARLRRKASVEGMQQQTQLLAQALKHELSSLQNELKDVKRAEALKSKLLKQAAQDLREPLANINMALHLLKSAGCDVERDRYISVLESECVRELNLLDDLNNVQTLLTPNNTSLLQKFQVLANS